MHTDMTELTAKSRGEKTDFSFNDAGVTDSF